MTLLYDGARCFFREESVGIAENVILHLPFAGTLIVNEGVRIAAEGGTAIIPRRFLKEGLNTLSLQENHRRIPAEGLYVSDEIVRPAGMLTRETVAALCLWCRSLEKRLTVAESALAEQKAAMPTLLFS